MSLIRSQRAIRQLGGFAGGTSHLARPIAPLEEPDVRPDSRSGQFCLDLIPTTVPLNVDTPLALDPASLSGSIDGVATFDGIDTFTLDGGPWDDNEFTVISAQGLITMSDDPDLYGLGGGLLIDDAEFGLTRLEFNTASVTDQTIGDEPDDPLVDYYSGSPTTTVQLFAHVFDRDPAATSPATIVSGRICVQWRVGL